MALIYHYCSPFTFQQVIERKKIWLSSTSNMNDYAEGNWFSNTLSQFLKRYQERYGKQWCESVLEQFECNHMPRYIACFSKCGDTLSQWRAYAQDGEGVAIGFDEEKLELEDGYFLPNIDPKKSIALKSVKYLDSEEIHGALFALAEQTIARFDGELNGRSAAIFTGLCLTEAMVVKNPAFIEEQEKRIIYSPIFLGAEDENYIKVSNPISEIKHRISSGFLTSYFEFQIPDSKAIAEVILGPKNKFSENDLFNFLAFNGLLGVTFKHSSATYR